MISDAEHRAMAGLSRGGMTTTNVMFNEPELFSAIGLFSGADLNYGSGMDAFTGEKTGNSDGITAEN